MEKRKEEKEKEKRSTQLHNIYPLKYRKLPIHELQMIMSI